MRTHTSVHAVGLAGVCSVFASATCDSTLWQKWHGVQLARNSDKCIDGAQTHERSIGFAGVLCELAEPRGILCLCNMLMAMHAICFLRQRMRLHNVMDMITRRLLSFHFQSLALLLD